MNLDIVSKINPVKLAVSKDSEIISIRSQIQEMTKFLDNIPDIKIGFRLYCIKNNIKEIPICPACGGHNKPNPADNSRGFTKFCSESCSRTASNLSDDVQSKLSSFDWMYEHRITLKMSKESIADILNISIQPVNKWIKIHGIPDVKYNCSDAEVSRQLNDKEYMRKLHVDQKKTCEEIAKITGSSKAVVSNKLRYHEIETNKSNSYKRKTKKVSRECQEVIDYLKTIYSGDIEINDRSILNGMELDIVIPGKDIAIEYNGVFSHLHRPNESSYSRVKDHTYHVSKTIGCEKSGIQLIHIWSSQWKEKNEIIKSILSAKLGLTKTVIYARKCVLKEIDTNTKNLFLDSNHIQGKDKSTFKYGLFYGSELVAVMTFIKSRFNKGYDWELSRFAVKKYTSVVGGFSKLLNNFRKLHLGSIISYADLMISNGGVYEKNGFTLVKRNKPAYWYVRKNSETLEHRFKFRKQNITDKSDRRSEREIMESLGYSRIWDCGTLAYALD